MAYLTKSNRIEVPIGINRKGDLFGMFFSEL